MTATPKPKLTQFALFCSDLQRMEDFYTRVTGLTVTGRGEATSAPVQMVFMSSDPGEHHQFVLVSGRPDDVNFRLNQQMSFTVESLDELRAMRGRVLAEEMEIDRCVTHGNAWSVYFKDPEDTPKPPPHRRWPLEANGLDDRNAAPASHRRFSRRPPVANCSIWAPMRRSPKNRHGAARDAVDRRPCAAADAGNLRILRTVSREVMAEERFQWRLATILI